MKRKDFICQTAIGLAALSFGVGCSQQKKASIPKWGPQTANAPIGDIRSLLLHLGRNMWCDHPSTLMGDTYIEGSKTLVRKPFTNIVWTLTFKIYTFRFRIRGFWK